MSIEKTAQRFDSSSGSLVAVSPPLLETNLPPKTGKNMLDYANCEGAKVAFRGWSIKGCGKISYVERLADWRILIANGNR